MYLCNNNIGTIFLIKLVLFKMADKAVYMTFDDYTYENNIF